MANQAQKLAYEPEYSAMKELPIHIDRVVQGQRDVVIVSLSRVDEASMNALEKLIDEESPDTVCLGIDAKRFEWTSDQDGREAIDLVEIIHGGQTDLLASYLAMSALHRKFAKFVGVLPGEEMQAAARAAHACGATVEMVDRSMVATCLRAWRLSSRWHRAKLSWLFTRGLFKRTEMRDESGDADQSDPSDAPGDAAACERLEQVRAAMTRGVPLAWWTFVDESSRYMAGRISEIEGDKILVVTSPAHTPSLREQLEQPPDGAEQAELDKIPEKTFASRALPWVITAAIIGMFIGGFAYGDLDKVQDAAVAWVLANGACGGLGAILSLAHPATVAAVFISAPIVSLNPAVGAGLVGALVQARVVPPTLRDMERVGDDLSQISGWWRNRLARLFVIFVLSNLGSTIGTFVALAWLPDVF